MTTVTIFTVTKLSALHPVLAAHARAIHRLAQSEAETIAEYCIEVGRHLAEARQRTAHEIWIVWIADEFGWNLATASRFIRAYTAALNNPISARDAHGDIRRDPSLATDDGSAA
jgi:hypothetical protein